MPTPKSFLLSAITVASLGCSSLTVTRINSAEEKPNNVWVFFTVEDGEEPVAGLTADDFEIYEDNELVSKYESKQTIINWVKAKKIPYAYATRGRRRGLRIDVKSAPQRRQHRLLD